MSVSPITCYKIYLQTGGIMTLSGEAFDPSTNPISLAKGWTWIGYPMSTTIAASALSAAAA